MKVLFIIPSNEPPVLEGNFSPRFKDFVAQCLKKSPAERPTAMELLQHPFIRSANHVSHLTDLLERNQIASDDHDEEEDFVSSTNSSNTSRSISNRGDRSQFGESSNSSSSSVFATSTGNGHMSNSTSTSSLSTEPGSFSTGGTDTVGGYLETTNGGEDHDRFARSKVHARAKSTSVDSGWDFNTIRISSSTTTTATTTTVSSSTFFAPTLEIVETPPPLYEAHVGYSEEIVRSSSAVETASDDGGDGTMDEDEEAFENTVKPAIFDVLGGAMDAEPLDEDDEEATKLREELLFDFLHAFESLNQEKGLLSKVLNSLLVNGSQ